jgi:hypothetical protein
VQLLKDVGEHEQGGGRQLREDGQTISESGEDGIDVAVRDRGPSSTMQNACPPMSGSGEPRTLSIRHRS